MQFTTPGIARCSQKLQSRAFIARLPHVAHRSLRTLAIETSCDDTAVAVLDYNDGEPRTLGGAATVKLLYDKKITSRNQQYGGVHPIVSLESHQENLALLVKDALHTLKSQGSTRRHDHGIDFVSVTRGPGMRSNLQTGLDVAKGLAVAWGVPLIGVHHMQAHALTPRLLSRLGSDNKAIESAARVSQPRFPFLSLLVSGGHTILIQSQSLVSHRILATTADIAIGDCLDKVARVALPTETIASSKSTMYGALLESFAFPAAAKDREYTYKAPQTQAEEIRPKMNVWQWALTPPFANSPGSKKANSLQFSFSGLATSAERVAERIRDAESTAQSQSLEQRRELAKEIMRVAFEHLASRVVLGLQHLSSESDALDPGIKTLVVSGGVAANGYLREILSAYLQIRGYGDLELVFPAPEYCTDNAAMIGWAGIEMYMAGYRTDLSVRSIRKWPLDQILNPPI